jgi:hypothetical protein
MTIFFLCTKRKSDPGQGLSDLRTKRAEDPSRLTDLDLSNCCCLANPYSKSFSAA